MLHNTFLYILMSFLFLNAADDDVLLLSQISPETQRVCIAPLVQQRGGLRSLKIIPTITPEIYQDLLLKPGEVLFFELALYKIGETQRICSDVIMVRQQEDQIYRKKIELPILNNSKGIIYVSIL